MIFYKKITKKKLLKEQKQKTVKINRFFIMQELTYLLDFGLPVLENNCSIIRPGVNKS